MVRSRKNMATVKIAENQFLIGGDASFGYTRERSTFYWDQWSIDYGS